MGQPVVHFEVMGSDAAKLQSFYSQLFDWQINSDNPMNYGIVDREANLDSGGEGIGGGIGSPPPGGPSYVTFYVQVSDVEAALVEAVRLGGARMMGPEEVMGGLEIGMLTDPEGHIVGVVKHGA